MENQFIFLVPFLNPQPISVVPSYLPSSVDIIAPYFRGIKPYKSYRIFDEMMRQSDRIGE